MSNELQHYGIPGMRWGVRKASDAASSIGRGLERLSDNKVFKATIYNKDVSLLSKTGREAFAKEFAASVSKGKSFVSKVSDTKLFKATVFNKDESLLTSAGRDAAKAKVKNLVKNFEKKQVLAQDKAIALNKEIVAGYKEAAKKKPLSSRDQKLMKEFEDSIKFMEEELTTLWTPAELEEYRSK